MNQRKKIALVAHRTKKPDLLEWARCNRALLLAHEVYASMIPSLAQGVGITALAAVPS